MFDIVGDVHGCDEELASLLTALGHPADPDDRHPQGRRLVFVGDLVDRGPATPAVLRRVMGLVAAGRALCVAGNHDVRLAEALRGLPVEPGHGLEESLDQLAGEPARFRDAVVAFIDALPGHLVLDDGRLVVAHAGLEEAHHGSDSTAARDQAIHGAYTGEFDDRPMPVRDDWAARYTGAAAVVQGHTPVAEAEWFRGTICIDTGCVYGGRLTALSWPERGLVSVPARVAWSRSARGALAPRVAVPRPVRRPPPELPAAAETARCLRELAAKAAPVPPADAREGRGRYVVHLPPTMSSCDPSRAGRPLEHPLGALAHYAAEGVRQVVCEEKHTGVRVVAIVCRDAAAARRRFGADDGSCGAIHSRVGRAVLSAEHEASLLDALRAGAGRAGLWHELSSDWLCLDGELVVSPAAARSPDDANRGAGDALALFHLLGAEGRTFFHEPHVRQLGLLARLAHHAAAAADVRVTRHRVVDLERPVDVAAAIAWWHDLADAGGEGIVVKPPAPAFSGVRGPVQPALKVRSESWLSRVYGAAANDAGGLEGLRGRSLATKRARALGQFALGVEALERFVAGEERTRVDACLDAILRWTPGG